MNNQQEEKPHSNIVVVVAAIISNTLVCIAKFVAAFITNSSAMLAEAIHSIVDIGNSVLVMVGIKRSKKPADAKHPFGYGTEIYFWTLIVAISIFGIGGGLSIFEGVMHIIEPRVIENPLVNYLVLLFGILIEGTSFIIAMKHFNKAKGRKNALRFIRTTKDPSIFTVVFEDSAAVIGLVIAFLGIFLSELLHMPVLDGVSSCLIGILLIVVAFFLLSEAKGLLIGEGLEPAKLRKMQALIRAHDQVEDIGVLRTLYLGPNDLLINIDIRFKEGLKTTAIDEEISEIEESIYEHFPEAKHIYIEVASKSDVRRRI